MKMVESLSQGIVESHREKMKNRLKRTFVGASDAASSKVKGRTCESCSVWFIVTLLMRIIITVSCHIASDLITF